MGCANPLELCACHPTWSLHDKLEYMRNRVILFVTVLSSALLGDTVTLKSGKTIEGTYVGGTARKIQVAVQDRVESYDINEVSEIRFGGSAPAAAEPARRAPVQAEPVRDEPRAPQRAEILRPERDAPPAPTPVAAAKPVEIPSGTSITVRMIDDIDSQRDRAGQTFRASVEEPVMVNGDTVVPRGADVVIKLVDDKESGKLTGKTELTLDVVSVQVNGRMVDIDTQEITSASESRTGKTAKVVGGTAALGAIIGAIAGGGKGAAIGAASGAAAGGAVQVLTKGQRVKVPSESRLTFTLQQPVRTGV